MKASMNVPVKPDARCPLRNERWAAYRDGYERGTRTRARNQMPPKHLLFDLSDYAVGFRVGYFTDAPDVEHSGKRNVDCRPR